MRLDPEESVIDEPSDQKRIVPVAKALARETYGIMPWEDIPSVEQVRFMRKARAFVEAHDAANQPQN